MRRRSLWSPFRVMELPLSGLCLCLCVCVPLSLSLSLSLSVCVCVCVCECFYDDWKLEDDMTASVHDALKPSHDLVYCFVDVLLVVYNYCGIRDLFFVQGAAEGLGQVQRHRSLVYHS